MVGVVVPQKAPVDPWAEFRDGTPAASVPGDPWAEFRDQEVAAKPAPPSTADDTVESLGSGVVRGGAETAMLPATLLRGARDISNYVADKGIDFGRYMAGQAPITDDQRKLVHAGVATITDPLHVEHYRDDTQDLVRRVMDDTLHKPATTPGHFAETIGEFAAPGGWKSAAEKTLPMGARKVGEMAANLFGNAVVPGVVSEAAGEAAKGTGYENEARLVGAIMGNGATAFARSASAPDTLLRRTLPENPNWQGAQDVIDRARKFGINVTAPEAIDHAHGGGTPMTDLLRVVEGSVDGKKTLGPVFAKRPEEVANAVGGVLDSIAPQSNRPYSLGPRAADTANAAIRSVEASRSAATEPFYRAADKQLVPQDVVDGIMKNLDDAIAKDKTGILSGPLNDLKARMTETPAKAATADAPAVPAKYINDIGNIDRVRKFFRDKLALPQIGQDAITKEQGAAVQDIISQLDNAMETTSSDFMAGKDTHRRMTQDIVDPIMNGPLGGVAKSTSTEAAGDALLPRKPLTGSDYETSDAIARMEELNPGSARALLRQNLSDRFGKAATETQTGSTEFSGAKFHKEVAGNDQAKKTLDEALKASGAQQAAKDMPEVLDALKATGRRKQIGSQTEFNRVLNSDASNLSPTMRAFNTAKSLGGNLITQAGDGLKQMAYRNTMSNLADLFTSPTAIQDMKVLAAKGMTVGLPEALTRALVQATVAARR